MAAKWPSSVATDADLFVAKNALATTLASTITNSDTTIALTNTTNFPVAGAVTIDQEIIFYTNISGSNLTGCVRGSDGTSIAGHNAGVPVSATIVAFHHNGLMAEIEAIESWLTTNVVASPLTANLPAAGFKLTGLGAGSTAGDSLRYEQVIGQFLLLSGGTLTGNLTIPVGSAAAPSLNFTGDTNTGLFQNGADNLGFSAGGVMAFQANPTGLEMGNGTKIFLADGSASAPSLTFSNDPNSGLYSGAGDDVYLSLGGTVRYTFLAGQMRFPNGSAAAPAVSFTSDTNSGIYSGGGDDVYISAGGTTVAQFLTTGVRLTGATTNSDAAAGNIGEYISSVVSTATNLPGTATYADGTSISLTAGDWDVTGTVQYLANGAIITRNFFGVSTTSGNSATGLVSGDSAYDTATPLAATRGGGGSLQIRASLAGTTTYYLKVYGEYTTATEQYTCSIRARRVR